jgi:uncharacterized protein (DUF433 family)
MTAPAIPLINVDPEILGGVPVFMGTRVPVDILPEWLAGGYTLEEFLHNFPTVSREQAVRFIEEGAALMLERYGTPPAR